MTEQQLNMNTRQCCKYKDHTFCHWCLKDLHDDQIDQKGCDRIGSIEALCKKCVFEIEHPFEAFFKIRI